MITIYLKIIHPQYFIENNNRRNTKKNGDIISLLYRSEFIPKKGSDKIEGT